MTVTPSPEIATELRRLLANSHAPHSGVHVAAGVETPDGRVHYGVNVENAAYPEGVCAEASAISALVTGGGRSIARVWLSSSLPGHIWPCGGCRQKILEFAEDGCAIASITETGEVEAHAIEELLPFGFRLRGSHAAD